MTTKDERAGAIERLREMFPRGSTVYTILRSVSRSGMQRTIGVVAFKARFVKADVGADSLPLDEQEMEVQLTDLHPNYLVSRALGRTLGGPPAGEGVKCNGAGMDMGFDLAYNLAAVLWGDGYALKHRWL